MAKGIHELNKKQIESFSNPGRYNDGGGLYLHIRKGGTKVWIYRFRQDGKLREMSLGPLTSSNDLREARSKASNSRELVRVGKNPIVEKSKAEVVVLKQRRKGRRFLEVISEFLEAKDRTGFFTTERTRRRWHHCLNVHVLNLFMLSESPRSKRQTFTRYSN